MTHAAHLTLLAVAALTSAPAHATPVTPPEGPLLWDGLSNRPFRLLSTELTWRTVQALPVAPPEGCVAPEDLDLPIECVTPAFAFRVANALSERAGLDAAYVEVRGEWAWDTDASGYHVPSGALWHAALCAYGWCDLAQADRPRCGVGVFRSAYRGVDGCAVEVEGAQPVGSKELGPGGVYDLIGNARELLYSAADVPAPGRHDPEHRLRVGARTPCCLVPLGRGELPAADDVTRIPPGMPMWTHSHASWATIPPRGVDKDARRVTTATRDGRAGVRFARWVGPRELERDREQLRAPAPEAWRASLDEEER